MAWADPLPGGGYRGGYRDSSGKKQYVKDLATGRTRKFSRKRDAREAATEEEVKASRKAAIVEGKESARVPWGTFWESISEGRAERPTETPGIEQSIAKLYLLPKWREVPLNKIITKGSAEHGVQEWVTELENGRVDGWKLERPPSPSYMRRIYRVFQASMTVAKDTGILTVSPCVGIELPKISKRAKPYLAQEGADQLRGYLREDYQDAVDFGYETGLRPGELCGLHICRTDRKRGWILVREVLVQRRGIIRPFPKDDDVRLVPCTPKALAILDRRIADRDLTQGCGLEHSDGSTCTSPLVFITKRGRPMRPGGIGPAMRLAAKKAKITPVSMYAVRRGFATRAAEGGLDAFALADLLGHADVRQTRE